MKWRSHDSRQQEAVRSTGEYKNGVKQGRGLRFLLGSAVVTFSALGLIMLSASCSSSPKAGEGNRPGGLPTKKTRTTSVGDGFRLRAYQEKTLSNGLKILYVEDNPLPYVSFALLVKSGASTDPDGWPGLTLFVAEMLEKGTAKRSATEIADDLGRMGADFSTTVTADYSLVAASSLSPHADQLLSNLVEVASNPAFSAPEVDRMKKQILAAIQKRIDDPDALADAAWDDFLFENHPYAKPLLGTHRSIQGLRRKHVIQHYLRHYRPNNSILAVTGQITPELMQKVETAFAAWEQREVPAVTYPEFPKIEKVEVRLVDNPALSQAQVRVGHKGIRRDNPDFIPLRVANTILGGAFASRLMDRIRKQLGLTYGVDSTFDARVNFGPFEISTFTKSESVGQTIQETLKVLEQFQHAGATDEELKRTKGYLRGVFPAAIETAEKFAQNLLLLRLYGIPDTYLSNYLRDLDRVSLSDINRVIQRYYDPKNLKVLVYGNSNAVLPQLQPLGIVDIKKATEYQ